MAEQAVVPAPPGSSRALKLIVGLAALIVILIGASQISKIAGPVFMALNLMIVIWPLQRWLSARIPRVFAAIVSGLVALAILVLFFWAIGWAISELVQAVPSYRNQLDSFWDEAIVLLGQFGITSSQILDQLKGIDAGTVTSVLGSLASNVSGIVSLLVVIVSVLLFMTIDSANFDERMQRVGKLHNPTLILALQSFAQGVRRYWVTSTVFGAIVSVLTYFGLLIIGVPLALVWAVLSFVTNYIPNIGFVIGLAPAMLMALLHGGAETGIRDAVLVLVVYSVINFVIQSMIQPKIAGDAVGVISTVSFLSLLVWAMVLGPLGALLALPATLLVKALLIDADPNLRWLNAFIASNPKTSSEEPLFAVEQVPGVDPLVEQNAPADDATFEVDESREEGTTSGWLHRDEDTESSDPAAAEEAKKPAPKPAAGDPDDIASPVTALSAGDGTDTPASATEKE